MVDLKILQSDWLRAFWVIHLFFKGNLDQASAVKVAYIFIAFRAENCLMVA